MLSLVQYVLLVIFIMLSAFFSASETALSGANRIRLKHKASEGNKRAARTISVLDSFDRALSAILIGNNVVNIGASSLATVICIQFFPTYGAVISTIAITVLVLIFGEVLPKSFAKENADSMSMSVSGIINALMIIFTPLVAGLTGLKKLAGRFLKSGKKEPTVTEEELKYMIDEIESEGVLEKEESELVAAALDFDETTADEILTPRVDLTAVEVHTDLATLKKLVVGSPYSRLPVFEGSLDNIIGALHQKDLFRLLLSDNPHEDWQTLIQEVLYVPPGKKISGLLTELQKKHLQMAVVSDQYGGTLGIVTLEDILEELVGDIWDESDEVVTELRQVGEHEFLVSADMHPEDLFEKLDCRPPKEAEDINTMGAFVLEQMEEIPAVGDSFTCGVLTVTVEEVQDNRITELRVVVAEETPDEEEK